jgi:hypothetical protein
VPLRVASPSTPAAWRLNCASTPAAASPWSKTQPTSSSALRVGLDLASNGSFKTIATLDQYTDIGFRI